MWHAVSRWRARFAPLVFVENLTQAESDMAIMLLFNVGQAWNPVGSLPGNCLTLDQSAPIRTSWARR
jgi:hypothetical protein